MGKPAKMGRPTKFVEETRKRLIEAISVGATYEMACAYAGIAYATFNQWMNGEFPRGIPERDKTEFIEAINAAKGEAAVKWLAKIEMASTVDWRAAAWKLEKRYPDEFGTQRVKQETTVSGPGGGPVQHQHDGFDPSALTDAEWEAYKALVRKGRAAALAADGSAGG